MLLVHWIRRAASRAAWTAGRSRAISTAMMEMTTSNSIRVNPRRGELPGDLMSGGLSDEGVGGWGGREEWRAGLRDRGGERSSGRGPKELTLDSYGSGPGSRPHGR